jgi:hypothetical protein
MKVWFLEIWFLDVWFEWMFHVKHLIEFFVGEGFTDEKYFVQKVKWKKIVDVSISRMKNRLDCKWSEGTLENKNVGLWKVEY